MSQIAWSEGTYVPSRRHIKAQRARRFAFLATALGAVGLLVYSGIAFTAQNASADVSVGPVTSAALVVTENRASLTPTVGQWATGGADRVLPQWSPIVGQPVSTGADTRDLLLIDARNSPSTTVTITVALRNAPTLANGYSTFILPVQVREAGTTGLDGATNWATTAPGGSTQYLTLTNPVVTFTITPSTSKVLEVVVPGTPDEGLVVAKSSDTNLLQPQFLVQAN